MNKIRTLLPVLLSLYAADLFAQPMMETGGTQMPKEWIDNVTGHRIMRITNNNRSNLSFYFHNNPFIGDEMVFYSSQPAAATDEKPLKMETSNANAKDKQIYVVNLKSLGERPLTQHAAPMNGEIAGKRSGNVYYQVSDSVFSVNIKTGVETLVYVFPSGFKASITTLNANETLLAGAWSGDDEQELLKSHPNKSEYFNLIYEAHLPRTLFTIDLKTKKLNKIFSDSAWLNHVQFSPTDPSLLMFCHEGPWHKVDRIWTIDVNSRKVKLIHHRSMPMEIAGHEWFAPNGKTIWFDLQMPKGETFFIAGANLQTGNEKRYRLTRDEWSIHFTCTPDEKLFCGDGGDSGQVAHAKDGRWIYLFKPGNDTMQSEKLVNMQHHNYHLEPNVHFSPDNRWIIFRANFEGVENVYAVEIAASKK